MTRSGRTVGRARLFLLLLAARWPLPGHSQDDTASRAIATVKPAVVLVVTTAVGEGVGSGTGFAVDGEGLVVTSAHVVEDAATVTVVVQDKVELAARVVGVDGEHDLALLKVEPALPASVSLSPSSDLKEGDSVLVTGYPFGTFLDDVGFGLTATTTRGMVTAIRTGRALLTEAPARFIQIDATANPGNSGGPVYLASTARAIGVLAGEIRPFPGEQTGLNIAIPAEYVLDLMEAVRQGTATVPEPRVPPGPGPRPPAKPPMPRPGVGAPPEVRLPGGGLPIAADGGKMLADPERPRVYVSEDRQNALTVVNTEFGAIEKRLSVGSVPAGLALSPNHATLYVALSGGSQLAVVDLETLTVGEPIKLGNQPFDLACVAEDKLYVTGSGPGDRPAFCVVEPREGTHKQSTGLYHNALVRGKVGGRFVFFGECGISPASVYRCDCTTAPLELSKVSGHGDIGGNLRDLQLSPDGSRLYVCCGAPYHVQILDAATFTPIGQLRTGPYPRRVALSPDGAWAFAIHGGNHVDVFDTSTFLSSGSIQMPSEVISAVVTGDGRKLAILCAAGLWLVELSEVKLAQPH